MLRNTALLALVAICLLACMPAHAVNVKPDGFPWNLSLQGEHDRPVIDKLGKGFFMNVGPTGIRAQITKKNPAYFTVRFVFPGSPAAGKVKAGDVIVGANGKVMKVPHKFGRGEITGWDGPMQEMAKLIEDSQAKDGKLVLMIWPGGNQAKAKKVQVQIPAVGRFSSTFPFNCERSDKLMIELCDFLDSEYQRKGSFGRSHVHTASTLALMASGENKYTRTVKDAVSRYNNKRYSSLTVGGYQCWDYGLDGVVIGEYYRLTGDKKMIPLARSISNAVAESQSPIYGGFSHKPFPVITRRVADGGGAGYGPLSSVTGLVMLGQSTFRAVGLDYDEGAYERMHQGFLSCWTGQGVIGYGMENWPHVVVEPVGKREGNGGNKNGIGYAVPDGMKWIGQFKLANRQPKGASSDTRWLRDANEKRQAAVYQVDQNRYLVVRDMSIQNAKRLPRIEPDKVMHLFRSGCAALAYDIGNEKSRQWQSMSSVYAKACAINPDAILDGHASTLMHTLWGSLGASRSDAKSFQRYMQSMKWWFIMAQTHDGSYVPMPGRDYASSDHLYAGRNFPTAAAALILSLKERKLLITGSPGGDSGTPASKRTPSNAQAAEPPKTGQAQGLTASILGKDFKIQYCQREANQLAGKTPYARILGTLDLSAKGDDARAKEAAKFTTRLRAWLTRRNKTLIALAKTKPATALARSAEHVGRLAGLDTQDAKQLTSLVDDLSNDNDTRTLSRYIIKYDQLAELEAKRGSTESSARQKDQIRVYLEKFLTKPDLSKLLRQEADAIYSAIEPTNS